MFTKVWFFDTGVIKCGAKTQLGFVYLHIVYSYFQAATQNWVPCLWLSSCGLWSCECLLCGPYRPLFSGTTEDGDGGIFPFQSCSTIDPFSGYVELSLVAYCHWHTDVWLPRFCFRLRVLLLTYKIIGPVYKLLSDLKWVVACMCCTCNIFHHRENCV